GLGAFQAEKLEQAVVVMQRYAPFLVVVVKHGLVCGHGPGATWLACIVLAAVIHHGYSRLRRRSAIMRCLPRFVHQPNETTRFSQCAAVAGHSDPGLGL